MSLIESVCKVSGALDTATQSSVVIILNLKIALISG